MRAGTLATIIAILIIIAVGVWFINWTGDDTVPVADTPGPTGVHEPTTPQTATQEDAPPQQTVGEPPAGSETRPAD